MLQLSSAMPYFGDGELEVRLGRDDAQVADHRQDDPGADRGAVDGADHRNGGPVDREVERPGLVGQLVGDPLAARQVGA